MNRAYCARFDGLMSRAQFRVTDSNKRSVYEF